MANRSHLYNTRTLILNPYELRGNSPNQHADAIEVAEFGRIIPVPWICGFRPSEVFEYLEEPENGNVKETVKGKVLSAPLAVFLDNLRAALPWYESIIEHPQLAHAYWEDAIKAFESLPLPYVFLHADEVIDGDFDGLVAALAGTKSALSLIKEWSQCDEDLSTLDKEQGVPEDRYAHGLYCGFEPQTNTVHTIEPSILDQEIEPFLALAERGDAQAQFEIAHRFELAHESAARNADSFAWMHKAATQGHAQAQFHLSEMYGSGYAKNIKFEEREELQQLWLEKAAENGYVLAQAELGRKLTYGSQAAEAIEWLAKAAGQMHGNSAFELGQLYSLGDHMPSDLAKALYWYRIAVANGHSTEYVGQMILQGEGISPNAKEALKWFQISADRGNVQAQLYLGHQYFYGSDVPIDAAKAAHWWGKAAASGSNDARYNLAILYLHGNGVVQNSIKAIEMFTYLADGAHTESMYEMGAIYAAGDYVAKDSRESVKWFRRGAKNGHASSQFQLARRLEHGDGTVKDLGDAMLWYKKAAEQGQDDAIKRLSKKSWWKF